MGRAGYLLIIISGILLFQTSCSLFKRGAKKEEKVYKDLRNLLDQQNIDYDWFATKSNVDLNSPMGTISANFQLRIRKDSAIWLSASKFGFEAVRAFITKDSIFAVIRLGRTYYAESIDSLSNAFGIPGDLAILQEVLVGNPWLPEKAETYYSYNPDSISVSAEYNGYRIQHGCYTPMKQLDYTTVSGEEGQQARIVYGDYKELDGQYKIPYFRHYQISDGYGEEGTAAFNFKEVEINVPQEMPFSIPKSYTKEQF